MCVNLSIVANAYGDHGRVVIATDACMAMLHCYMSCIPSTISVVGGVCCQPALMVATGDVIDVCYYAVTFARACATCHSHILTVNHGGADTVDGGGDARSMP